MSFVFEEEELDYYFFYGDYKKILDNYTELTGKGELPPKWSFGTWISRISYKSQAEVMQVAEKMRKMKFPSDIIHIDTHWFKEDWKCDWKFNEETFPDPEKMFRDLKKEGFRVSLWQSPYLFHGTEIYKEAKKKKNILAKNNGPFIFMSDEASAIDFSSKEAIKWYQNKLKNLFELGAAVIKVDFGEGVEPHMKFKEYNGREMHNLYALLYNKAAFDITKEYFGEGIIWARSAYAGSQRYPLHWSGDNSSNFENLLCSLRGGLSFGLSGFTFWSQDTGGFMGTPTDEEYIRWTQLSIFQSHIRYHGGGPRFKEPWNYKPETQDIVRNYLNLRYQLIPYLYTESKIAVEQGLPLLKALVIEYLNDPTVYNIEDQFLCGRNLLIAPILTKNNTRKIYIPEGLWYDYWNLEEYKGPQWIIQTHEIETIPILVKGGTILPLGSVAQSTDQMTNDYFKLLIFPDLEQKASYKIIDKEKKMAIESSIENEILKIQINPKPSNLEIKYPKNQDVSEILVNGKKA
jgi:alpha-D-xyloside xylohydrolase